MNLEPVSAERLQELIDYNLRTIKFHDDRGMPQVRWILDTLSVQQELQRLRLSAGAGTKPVFGHDLHKQGGGWLATARSWLQCNVPRGDHLTWGSNEPITITVDQFERAAADIAARTLNEARRSTPEPSTCHHDYVSLVGGVRCLKCGHQIAGRIIGSVPEPEAVQSEFPEALMLLTSIVHRHRAGGYFMSEIITMADSFVKRHTPTKEVAQGEKGDKHGA